MQTDTQPVGRPKGPPKDRITIWLDQNTAARVRDSAAENFRSVSAQIEYMVTKYAAIEQRDANGKAA